LSRPSKTIGVVPRRGVVLVAALASVAGCAESPVAPTGPSSVAIGDASVPDGGTAFYGRRVEVRLTIDVPDELLKPGRLPNGQEVPASAAGFVCFSVDGVRFTSTCTIVGVQSSEATAGLQGPSASAGFAQTRYFIAFLIPVSAFNGFGAGDVIPDFALARAVKPWVLSWEEPSPDD
jgi:hypothetical protein